MGGRMHQQKNGRTLPKQIIKGALVKNWDFFLSEISLVGKLLSASYERNVHGIVDIYVLMNKI